MYFTSTIRNKEDYSKHIYCNLVLSLDRTYSAISLKKQFNCLEVTIHSIVWLFDKTNPANSKVCLCVSDDIVGGKKLP